MRKKPLLGWGWQGGKAFEILIFDEKFFSSLTPAQKATQARNNKAIYAVSDNFIIAWSAIQIFHFRIPSARLVDLSPQPLLCGCDYLR